MRTSLLLAFTLATLLGCQDASPPPSTSAAVSGTAATPQTTSAQRPAAAAPKGPSRPQKDLTVTVDGKPVEMITALAWKTPEGKTEIELSSVPLGCADVAGNGRAIADGEVTFGVSFKPMLEKDGTIVQHFGGAQFSGMNQMVSVPAKVTGDGAEGKSTTAEIEVEITSASKPERALVAKGKIDAIGCPAPKGELPALPPPTDLVLEIAGKKFPVRSAAIIEEPDRTSFTLYTGGEDCKGSGTSGDAGFEVIFEKGKPWQLAIRGAMVPQALDQTFDKKKVTVKLPAKAPGDVELAVDTAVVGYPVKIKGKVAAQTCAR